MSVSAKVAYVRVSSADQNPDRQIEKLKEFNPDKFFIDKESGKNLKRPAFTEMMNFVQDGDELIICSMDRLARNLKDLLAVTQELQARGVTVKFLKESVTLSPTGENSAISKLLLSMMGAVAEFERSLIRERQMEGIALAKARGQYRGRKPIDPDLIEKAKELRKADVPVVKIAKRLGVSRATLYRYFDC